MVSQIRKAAILQIALSTFLAFSIHIMKKLISTALLNAKRESIREFNRCRSGQNLHPKWPLEVFLEISNICDLQCAMCHMFSGINVSRQAILRKHKRGFIDLSEIGESLDAILEHALVVHAFGYGEPTIHPNFVQVLEYLGKFAVKVDFFSHGNNLSQELCDLLVTNGVAEITISLSGSTKEDYENVYLGGKYEKVMASLARLKATRERMKSVFPEVVINSIGFHHHVMSLPAFVGKMADVGVSRIHLKPLLVTDAIRELQRHVADPNDLEVRAMIAKARQVGKQHCVRLETTEFETTVLDLGSVVEEFVPITMFPSKAKSAEMKRAMRDFSREPPVPVNNAWKDAKYFKLPAHLTPCLEPFKTFYLAQSGNVYPCCFKNDQMMLGNIQNSTASDIWSNQFSDLRTHIANGEYPEQLCRQCVTHTLYPKNHGADGIALRYGYWLRKVYGRFFLPVTELFGAARYVIDRLQKRNQNKLLLKRYRDTA